MNSSGGYISMDDDGFGPPGVDQIKRIQNGRWMGWTLMYREHTDTNYFMYPGEIQILPPQPGDYHRPYRWISRRSASFPGEISALIKLYGSGYAGMSLLEFLIKSLQD